MFTDHALIHLSAMVLATLACAMDLRTRQISNALILAGVAAGLALNFTFGGIAGVGRSLMGGGIGLALFLPFFALGGMGGGDVKLMAALGSLVGPVDILKVSLAASLAGGLLALSVVVRERRVLATLKNIGGLFGFWLDAGLRPSPDLNLENPSTRKIPYALPVAAGVLVVLALSRW